MSIIASIIGSVILAIRKLALKRISPKCTYIIWIVFMITLIFPVALPSRISVYNYIRVDKIKAIKINNKNYAFNRTKKNDFETGIMNMPLEENANMQISTNFKNYIKFILSVIWIVITLKKLIQLLLSYIHLNRDIGNDIVNDERILAIFQKCKQHLKIRKEIKIINQNIQRTPSIMGIRDVRILLTEEILKLDDKQIEHILMHELSHFKRKDNIQNIIISVLKSIYWFNPIMMYMFQYVKSDMELATDEFAIDKMSKKERKEYCRVIVAVAGMCNLKAEAVLGLISGKEALEQRIDMILKKEKFEEYFPRIILFTILVIMFIWLFLYPTSYGKAYHGNLSLKFKSDGKDYCLMVDKENEKTIKITCGEEIKVVTDNDNYKNVFYSIKKLNDDNKTEIFGVASENIAFDEVGEYSLQICVLSQDYSSIEYNVKVVVE